MAYRYGGIVYLFTPHMLRMMPREGGRCKEEEPSRRESGIFLVSECVEETQITATAVITVEDIRSGCRTGTCI